MILSKFFPCDVQMCVVMTLLVGGCATTVIPPAHPIDPMTVYLTDYGRHSSLLLPTKNGYDEYAFGDWNWFVLGRTQWWVALHAMVLSPQATLGRRHIDSGSDEQIFAQLGDCKRLMQFQASQLRVETLLLDLDARFGRDPQPPIFSDYCKLYCVRDSEVYWGLHNCNNVTAGWLKRLGCQIKGLALYSNFYLRK
jgi:hypothetical protein